MLQVTQAATEYLNNMLVRMEVPSDSAVRIVPKAEGGGLATTIDRERDGDQHYDCQGRTVLVLDSAWVLESALESGYTCPRLPRYKSRQSPIRLGRDRTLRPRQSIPERTRLRLMLDSPQS